MFVTLERRSLPLSALRTAAPNEAVALAAISASELLVGALRADTPERRVKRETFVEGILGVFPVFGFDLHVARIHARLWAELTAKGERIGDHDLLIAATAQACGYAVLTENVRHFDRVSGLTVRQPTW